MQVVTIFGTSKSIFLKTSFFDSMEFTKVVLPDLLSTKELAYEETKV